MNRARRFPGPLPWRVEWDHPLADGLIAAWTVYGNLFYDILEHCPPLYPINGSPTFTRQAFGGITSPIGLFPNYQRANSQMHANKTPIPFCNSSHIQALSLGCWYRQTVHGVSPYQIPYIVYGHEYVLAAYLQYQASDAVEFNKIRLVVTDGVNPQLDGNSGPDLGENIPSFVAGIFSTNRSVFRDLNLSSTTTTGTVSMGWVPLWVSVGGSGLWQYPPYPYTEQPFEGSVGLPMLWTRALTANDVVRLNNGNFFRELFPLKQRRQFFLGIATTAATSATSELNPIVFGGAM